MDTKAASLPSANLIHCDSELVAVDKPSGLPATVSGDGPTLLDGLPDGLFQDDEPLRAVQRLDRDASGVVVLARSALAARALTEQLDAGPFERTYLALVRGYVESDGEVNQPIRAEDERTRGAVDHRRGRPAVTAYRVLERLVGNTLLEIRPRTDRLHQIRIHMGAIRHPLSIDPLYGGSRELLLSSYKPGYKPNRRGEERPLIARLTLHAAEIAFDHPTTGERVRFESPLPKDLRAALNQLRRLH